MNHFGALIALLTAIFVLLTGIGGLLYRLLKSWWSMQEAIKKALKADTELKNSITKLVQEKERFHTEISVKHTALTKRVTALERGR